MCFMRCLLASLALSFTLFLSSTASADEPTSWIAPVITPVTKGALAPFTGILLTPEAVARVIAEAKDCPKRMLVETDRARAEEKAHSEKTLANAVSDTKRDREIAKAAIEQRDDNIKDLTTRLEKSESARGNAWLWAGGGVLVGAVIVTLSIMVVGAAK